MVYTTILGLVEPAVIHASGCIPNGIRKFTKTMLHLCLFKVSCVQSFLRFQGLASEAKIRAHRPVNTARFLSLLAACAQQEAFRSTGRCSCRNVLPQYVCPQVRTRADVHTRARAASPAAHRCQSQTALDGMIKSRLSIQFVTSCTGACCTSNWRSVYVAVGHHLRRASQCAALLNACSCA